jgi:hypothetical protein
MLICARSVSLSLSLYEIEVENSLKLKTDIFAALKGFFRVFFILEICYLLENSSE